MHINLEGNETLYLTELPARLLELLNKIHPNTRVALCVQSNFFSKSFSDSLYARDMHMLSDVDFYSFEKNIDDLKADGMDIISINYFQYGCSYYRRRERDPDLTVFFGEEKQLFWSFANENKLKNVKFSGYDKACDEYFCADIVSMLVDSIVPPSINLTEEEITNYSSESNV
jgi:hypothetical protein